MKYRVSHLTKYDYTNAVPVCHNLVHLAPRPLPNQSCNQFELSVSPPPRDHARRHDAFGNTVDYFCIQDPHRTLNVLATSELEVHAREFGPTSTSWETVAENVRSIRTPEYLDAFQYTFASTCVPVRNAFAEYAKASFSNGRDIIEATRDITVRIYREFEYNPRATTVSTPVAKVFRRRAGVCQDFAHLQIACLRSLGIPARYVSGYLRTVPPAGQPRLIGADASHAWLSVFCGEAGWVDFDPTNRVIPDTDYVTIAWGRDYQDVCPVQGIFIGGGRHSLTISVDVAPE